MMRELEYHVNTNDEKQQLMFVVVSENFEGRGYPDVVFDYEEDAQEYKQYREKEDENVMPSFKRYFRVVRVIKNPTNHRRTP